MQWFSACNCKASSRFPTQCFLTHKLLSNTTDESCCLRFSAVRERAQQGGLEEKNLVLYFSSEMRNPVLWPMDGWMTVLLDDSANTLLLRVGGVGGGGGRGCRLGEWISRGRAPYHHTSCSSVSGRMVRTNCSDACRALLCRYQQPG
jgi:hypothetical protein